MSRSTLVEQAVLATEKAKEYVNSAGGVISKARSLVAGDALFFATAPNLNDLRRSLNSDSLFDKCDAMKKIVAQMCKGVDMHILFPDVVKNIHAPSIEMRKLVYLFVVQYAEQCPHEALLSVSAFQKDLNDTSMHVRSLALRMLSGIRIPTIQPVVMVAIRRCADDHAALVRKTAALALLQIHSVNRSETDSHEVIDILRKLLSDRHQDVLGAAIATYECICPDAYELIHPIYRSLCKKLVDCAEWDQVSILRMLLRYARHEFNDPTASSAHIDQNLARKTSEDAPLPDAVLTPANKESSLKSKESDHTSTPQTTTKTTTSADESEAMQDAEHILPLKDSRNESDSTSSSSSGSDADIMHQLSGKNNNKNKNAINTKSETNKKKNKWSEEHANSTKNNTDNNSFYDDNDSSNGSNNNNKVATSKETAMTMVMSEDHQLLLRSVRPLLHSLNSAVIAGVVAIYFHCAPVNYLDYCVLPLIRLLRSCSNGQSVILSIIRGVMRQRKDAFASYVEEFYLLPHDGSEVRQRKLQILTLLISHDNFDRIYQEFKSYVRSYSVDCVVEAIHTLAIITTSHSEFASHIVRLLTPLLSHPNARVITEAINVLRLLVIQGKHSTLTARLIFRLLQQAMNGSVQSATALSAILWLVGENIRLHAAIASAAPDCFRVFASKFCTQEEVVKYHVLTLGCKIWLHLGSAGAMATRFRSMYKYVIELAKFDNDYKLRDYARLLENSIDKDGEVYATLKEVLLADKAAPHVIRNIDKPKDLELGTCSYFFNHTFSAYDKLPEWNVHPVDDARRFVANTSPTLSLTSQNVLEKHYLSDSDSISSATSSQLSSSSESEDEESSDDESSISEGYSSSSSSTSESHSSESLDASSQTASDDSAEYSDTDSEHHSKLEHNESTSSSHSSSSSFSKTQSSSRVNSSQSPSATSQFAKTSSSKTTPQKLTANSSPSMVGTQAKIKGEQNEQDDKTTEPVKVKTDINDNKVKEKEDALPSNDDKNIGDASNVKSKEKEQAETEKNDSIEKHGDEGKQDEQPVKDNTTNLNTANTT